MELIALLTRPTAMIAVFAGIIVLCIAAYLYRAVRRRREEREAIERRGQQIVRKLRYCPFFNKEHDRRLAAKFAKELDDFIAKEGYTFERLGITRAEVEKIVRQTTADPPNEKAKQQLGLIAEHKDRHRAATPQPQKREPIVPPVLQMPVMPSELTLLAEQVEPYGATFTEADFAPCNIEPELAAAHAVAARADEVPMSCHGDKPADPLDDLDLSDFEDPAPPPKEWSDPIKALQSAGDDELESYVDDRIEAIQMPDEDE